MKTYIRIIALVVALVAVAAPAQAQREKLASRLDAATRAQLDPVLDEATTAGLPIDPLVQKALEGASKRAPSDRIVLAVRRLATQLGTARTALGGSGTSAELVAGASALQAGVRPEMLASLRSRRPDASLTVPLGVLAELIARGVPADTGAMAVTALVDVGMTDAQLVALRRDVERDIGIGAPPTTALIARATGFSEGFSTTFRGGDAPLSTSTTPTRRRP